MMWNRKARHGGAVLGLAVFLLLGSRSSPGALVSVNSPQFGADTLTRDTATGLEWLDLTVTLNRSFNNVSARLAPGRLYDGFRYATLEEVEALWAGAGITDRSGGFSSANVAGVMQLVALMGETNTANGTRPGDGLGHIGLTPLNAQDAQRSFLELSLDQATARANLDEWTTPVDFVLPDRIGHYLVRIPEPGGALQVLPPLVLLLGVRGRPVPTV